MPTLMVRPSTRCPGTVVHSCSSFNNKQINVFVEGDLGSFFGFLVVVCFWGCGVWVGVGVVGDVFGMLGVLEVWQVWLFGGWVVFGDMFWELWCIFGWCCACP